jgi:hypothetical protein
MSKGEVSKGEVSKGEVSKGEVSKREMSKGEESARPAGQANYRLTEQERAALAKNVARRAAETPAPRVKVSNDSRLPKLVPDHPDRVVGYALLMEALGSADIDFVQGLLGQLVNASSRDGQIDQAGLNFMLSVIKGIKPNDPVEAMLGAQMAAMQPAIMTFVRRLAHAETPSERESAERALNKLTRSFTALVEALKRYRTGGEQRLTVQHVSVSEGGQAIVGNVTQARSGRPLAQPAAARPVLTNSQQSSMPIVEESLCEPIPLRRSKKDVGSSSA